ncbi:hypothetical protein ASG21_04845 [Chryseobacterium sp. Leaf394]|nr:hypothetical protein ASG21_04845 [Chryseobacterium sp. Leaf394]
MQIFGQDLRVVYDYKYHIDSLNIENEQSEYMILDIEKTRSIFCSYPKFVNDSLMFNRKLSDFQVPVQSDKSKIKDLILKDYKSHRIFLYTQIGPQAYKIDDDTKVKWDISAETKNFNGIKVQKASANFIGRSWTAWFSNDYPFQDGPYKFRGLPGLILELYDEDMYHHFKMLSIKRRNFVKNYTILELAKEFTAVRFAELWRDYVQNPSKFYISSGSNSGYNMSVTMDGKSYSEVELLREIEKREKEKLEKINNFLDLELYRKKKN